MGGSSAMDPANMLGRIGRHWGWLLAFGIVTLAAGLCAIFWPGETLVILAIIFGIQLIVTGVFELIEAFAPVDPNAGGRWFMGLLGGLSIVVGVLCLHNVFATLLGLALLLGVYWIVHGVMSLFHAIADHEAPSRAWTGLAGGVSVLAGIVLIVWPSLSLFYLAIVLGIWLVVYGAIMIWASFRLRAVAHQRPTAVAGSPSPT